MRVTIKYARGPVHGQFECDYVYDKGKFARLDEEHAEERSFHQLMTDLCWRANLEMYEKTANTKVIYQIYPVPSASQTSPSAGQQTLRQYVEAHHLNIFGNNKGRRMVLFCMPCWCYVFIWVWLKYALSSPRYFIPLFVIVCLLLSLVADVTLPDWAYLRNFTATKRLLRQ